MHFANFSIDAENQRFESWFCMQMKEDLLETLKECGRLPQSSMQACLEDIAEMKRMKEFIKAEGL
jgi:hypothetical protein